MHAESGNAPILRQLVDKVLYGESLCDPLRGALYRRAPLSEKRSTGSFYQIHPCGAPKV